MTATTYLERYKQLISIENSKNSLIEVAPPNSMTAAMTLILFVMLTKEYPLIGPSAACNGTRRCLEEREAGP